MRIFCCMRNDDNYNLASSIARDFENLRPLDFNMTAMMTAQLLADGKSKRDLQNLCNFLQLLLVALKSYTNC